MNIPATSWVLCLLVLGCTAARNSQSGGVVREAETQAAVSPADERADSPENAPDRAAFDSEQRVEKAVQALKRSRENGSLEAWRYLSENYDAMPILNRSVFEYSWGAFEIDVKKRTFSVSYNGGDLVNTIRGEFVGDSENEWKINLVLK